MIKPPQDPQERWIPGDSEGEASTWNVGEPGSIPGSGRSPGEENSNPFQYSCPENPMDRGGAWRATVHRITELDMTEWLHFHFFRILSETVTRARQVGWGTGGERWGKQEGMNCSQTLWLCSTNSDPGPHPAVRWLYFYAHVQQETGFH